MKQIKKTYPTIFQSILMLFTYQYIFPFIILGSLSILTSLVPYKTHFSIKSTAETYYLNFFIRLISLVILIKYLSNKKNFKFKDLFSIKIFSFTLFIWIISLVLGISIIRSELINFLGNISSNEELLSIAEKQLVFGKLPSVEFFLSIVLFYPIFEEFIFRGIILKGYLSNYSEKKALIVSALLFGAYHMNPQQFITASIGGLVYGWIYIKTKSIIPCIFAHSINNLINFIFINLLQIEIPNYTIVSDTSQFQPLWFDILGITLVIISIYQLKKIFKNKEECNYESENKKTRLDLLNKSSLR
ncbi:CPBP family intramembrane glutamic endopeptidase [Tepidibacter formicigenes]|jgi:membrane protease YdiL (CAAX protease family)|uniref:CAAX protease self-immunity n=1 Tax=Tepidibacter formicigenes DSM 15518 TaxID=1123349 RepID=A0A1M6UE66_9FIRM|nr:type II CAAX endopeptidase family protein [Tepidibacter formicigenes]SHK67348.1 CAAX protease self-immunity [Tepidibacter formicigenes DSM 15518]